MTGILLPDTVFLAESSNCGGNREEDRCWHTYLVCKDLAGVAMYLCSTYAASIDYSAFSSVLIWLVLKIYRERSTYTGIIRFSEGSWHSTPLAIHVNTRMAEYK